MTRIVPVRIVSKTNKLQLKQQDRERVNLDRREVDNSESCCEGGRVEREKSNVLQKFKTTREECPRYQNVNSSRNG